MKIEDCINLEDLNIRMEGDIELFRELADIFINDVGNLIGNIEAGLNSEDAVKVSKAAHTLKGAVSNFSADKAFQAAFKLEMIGKENRMSDAKEAFKIVQMETDKLVTGLKILKESQHL